MHGVKPDAISKEIVVIEYGWLAGRSRQPCRFFLLPFSYCVSILS